MALEWFCMLTEKTHLQTRGLGLFLDLFLIPSLNVKVFEIWWAFSVKINNLCRKFKQFVKLLCKIHPFPYVGMDRYANYRHFYLPLPGIHFSNEPELRVELTTAWYEPVNWFTKSKNTTSDNFHFCLRFHSAAKAELPAHLHSTPKCKVASLARTKL